MRRPPRLIVDDPSSVTAGWAFWVPHTVFGMDIDLMLTERVITEYAFGKKTRVSKLFWTRGTPPKYQWRAFSVFYPSESASRQPWAALDGETVIQIDGGGTDEHRVAARVMRVTHGIITSSRDISTTHDGFASLLQGGADGWA